MPIDFVAPHKLAEIFAHQNKPRTIIQFTMSYVKVAALAYQFQTAEMVCALIHANE